MIQKFEKMDGELRKATGFEVQGLTLQGWHLVFSFEETVLENYREEELVPSGEGAASRYSTGYGNQNGTISLSKMKPVTHTRFMLRKGADQRLAELQGELGEAQRLIASNQKAISTLREDLKKSQDRALALENNAKVDGDRFERLADERDRYRKTHMKLEGDLAKVRKAIGERAFTEILPPDVKPV